MRHPASLPIRTSTRLGKLVSAAVAITGSRWITQSLFLHARSSSHLPVMAPTQSTLNSFFKKGSGSQVAAPPPQQTKLSFSTKATSKKKTKEEEKSVGDEDDAKGTSKKRHRTSSRSTSPAKKIKSEDDGSEVDADDDEHVVKRPRRRPRHVSDDEVDEEKEEKVDISTASSGRKKRTKRSSSTASEEPHQTSSPRRSVSPKRKAAAAKQERDDDVRETDSEADSHEDEDDEKPAAAKAKTASKIQTKLVSDVEDPYPDWVAGEPVPYAALCTTFSLVELTTKRLIIMEHCSRFLRQVMRLTPDDLLPTVLLMVNKLAPDYAGIELGIGESLIMKAIGETTGRSLQVVKQDQKEVGDLGLVAVKSKSTQKTMFKPKQLTIRAVHKGLMDIATVTGNGAQGRKVDGIKKLIASADVGSTVKVDITKDKGGPSEAKFIVRFLEGKLRLGLAERTVLVSLAQAMICREAEVNGKAPDPADVEKGEAILKTVYSELPSYDVIIPAMVERGIMRLRETCKLRPGVPLKPMLAKPTKAITEVLDRFENQTFTCEYKYDGERAQIHYVSTATDVNADADEDADADADTDAPKDVTKNELSQPLADAGISTKAIAKMIGKGKAAGNGVASIFSRNSEDLSKKYPDVLSKLHTWVKPDTRSFVIDCETVAWDVVEKKLLPFQQLMTRKKKDVKVEDVKVKVCVFAFDLLYLNGEPVVEKPLRERREMLREAFYPVEGQFAFATHMNGRELDEIQTFLDESVKASCEGLMVKMLDGAESGYEPSKRSRNWLKIKKDYLSGIGDSLDLVVIGAYYGKGKRTSVYGAFLLACYNPAAEAYETVCNIGTGFSEQVLDELHDQLSELAVDRPKPFYSHSSVTQHQPDVWFEPRFVWEVKAADLTLSPRYKAGWKDVGDGSGGGGGGGGERGISLRFPRFIKIRDDKKPDEATTSRQVAEMYRRQESVAKSQSGGGAGVDDDFEY